MPLDYADRHFQITVAPYITDLIVNEEAMWSNNVFGSSLNRQELVARLENTSK